MPLFCFLTLGLLGLYLQAAYGYKNYNFEVEEVTRNLTISVASLAEKVDLLSTVINTTIGYGMLKELSELTFVLKDIMGKRVVETVDRVDGIINTTVLAANHITSKVDTTAKDATHDLNVTVR